MWLEKSAMLNAISQKQLSNVVPLQRISVK